MLLQEIKKRMMAAMKAGKVVEKEVLRVVIGEVTGAMKDDDDTTLAVVKKLVKSNRETMGLATDDEQKRTLAQEIEILQEFLPKTLDATAIMAALEPVREAIRAAGNDGQATGVAMKHLKAAGAAVEPAAVKAAVTQLRA
jgi:uncharacterized protein YqeY